MSIDSNQSGANSANVILPPPVIWALALISGAFLEWRWPEPITGSKPTPLFGALIFAAGLGLALWSIATIRRANSHISTNRPTTAIVSNGPYRFSRNPIYVAMLLGQIGVAIGINSIWIFAMSAPLFIILKYGVVLREEAYLERKFGSRYVDYTFRVRRWL